MLEIMTAAQAPGFQGPWNGVLPPQDQNTLFRMHTFSTTADIKDKGPNALAVTNSNVTVGSDVHGTYMKFNGSSSALAFQSALISSLPMDINIILGDLVYVPTALYDITVIDGRPNITNGRYFFAGVGKASPFRTNLSFQGAGYYGDKTVPQSQLPCIIKCKLRQGYFSTEVNGVEVQRTIIPDNTLSSPQIWRVGRNAYVQQAATPWLNAKIYYIDFKKV